MDPIKESTLKPRSRNLGKIIAIIFLVLLFGIGIFIWWRYYYTYSDGFRYGLLQKFSHRGSLFKTYEGEMILSSVRGNVNVPIASEKFFFSVTDDSVAQKLMNLQGHSIAVGYKEKNSAVFWRGDSRYIVELDYKNIQNEISKRRVEPIGLIFYAYSWHLVAWCQMRNDYRDFKVARILKVKNTCEPFTVREHIRLAEYLKQLPVAY